MSFISGVRSISARIVPGKIIPSIPNLSQYKNWQEFEFDGHWYVNNQYCMAEGPYQTQAEAIANSIQIKAQFEAQAQYKRQREQRRQELYWALRTRVINDAEMNEIKQQWDYRLTAPYTDSQHNYKEKMEEFNAALERQFRMRLALEESRARMVKDKGSDGILDTMREFIT